MQAIPVVNPQAIGNFVCDAVADFIQGFGGLVCGIIDYIVEKVWQGCVGWFFAVNVGDQVVSESRCVELVQMLELHGKRKQDTHCDDVVIFHEPRLVSREETQHGEDECHNGKRHWQKSCETHFGCS